MSLLRLVLKTPSYSNMLYYYSEYNYIILNLHNKLVLACVNNTN